MSGQVDLSVLVQNRKCTDLEWKQCWPGKGESSVPARLWGFGSSVFPFKDFYFCPQNTEMDSSLYKSTILKGHCNLLDTI